VDRPFIYFVKYLSNGGTYCTRSIEVRQPKRAAKSESYLKSNIFDISDAEDDLGPVCFASIASFKRAEYSTYNHQEEVNLREKYRIVLGDKGARDHKHAPTIDSPWYMKIPITYLLSS